MSASAVSHHLLGKRELDEFIALLEEHEIDYLVDVRSVPYSRFRPEFSKAALDAAVGRRGIEQRALRQERLPSRRQQEETEDEQDVVHAARQDVLVAGDHVFLDHIEEAARLGYRRVVLPRHALPPDERPAGVEYLEVRTIGDAVEAVLGDAASRRARAGATRVTEV